MPKVKCPSCDAELDIPEDPRMAEMVEQLAQSNASIAKMTEMLEKAGKPVPPEVSKVLAKGKKKVKKYEGIFLEDSDEIEVDDDAEADKD